MLPNYDVGDKEEEGINDDSGVSGPNTWGTDVTSQEITGKVSLENGSEVRVVLQICKA